MDFREILLRKINKPVAISIINCCEVIVGILVHVEDGFIQLIDLTGHIIDIPFCSITAVHEAQDTLGDCFGPCARFAFGPCGGPFGMYGNRYNGNGYYGNGYDGNGYYGNGYDGKGCNGYDGNDYDDNGYYDDEYENGYYPGYNPGYPGYNPGYPGYDGKKKRCKCKFGCMNRNCCEM